MEFIRPPALNKGDTIGIVSPSSYIEPDILDAGVEVLRDYGFKVSIHPQALARDHQSAGSPAEKAAALHQVFLDPEIKAVIGAGGGNRAAHALSSVDFDLLRRSPKIYMGLSDSTSLLSGLAAKSGLVSFFGPLVKTLPKTTKACLDYTFTSLSSKADPFYPLEGAVPVQDGKGQGRLYGGTLSVLCSLIGTPYLPNMKGSILFLEDTNDELSRYDRMLWQLNQALPFKSLAGIVFGQFLNPLDTGRPFGFSLEDIIKEHTKDLDIPVLMNAPFGHGELNYALPIGLQAELSVSAGEAALKLLESPVLS